MRSLPLVAIVMPARNEARAIGVVLEEIPRELVRQVIVVDNGSTDDTAGVARAHGATVVTEAQPGYGIACQRGIAAVDPDTDIVVILDADHSDYPQDLHDLLAPIANDEADLVIGSRVMGRAEKGALPWNQRWGNWLAALLMRGLYRRRFTDMGPFRAMRLTHLVAWGMKDRTFGWNVEMTARAILHGSRILEVPVRYRRRIGKSKISGTIRGTVMAGTMIIGTILRFYPSIRRSGK